MNNPCQLITVTLGEIHTSSTHPEHIARHLVDKSIICLGVSCRLQLHIELASLCTWWVKDRDGTNSMTWVSAGRDTQDTATQPTGGMDPV